MEEIEVLPSELLEPEVRKATVCNYTTALSSLYSSQQHIMDDEADNNIESRPCRNPSCSKVTPLLVLSVFSAVFGSSTQFGYNLGVLNNIETVSII